MERIITEDRIHEYRDWLEREELSPVTVENYVSVIRRLADYLDGREISRENYSRYREWLLEKQKYKKNSVNTFIFAINGFCRRMGWEDIAQRGYTVELRDANSGSKYIDRTDYKRLIGTAMRQGNYRLALILQTPCHMDIRFSEFSRLTVEAAVRGFVEVTRSKRKRQIGMPGYLQKALLNYAEWKGIKSGVILKTNRGNPVDRTNIWKDVKKLCRDTRIDEDRIQLIKFKMPKMHDYYPFYPLPEMGVERKK